MTGAAMRMLHEACHTERLWIIRAMYGHTEEENRLIAFKCSLWPVTYHAPREADENIAAAIRKELDVPEDRKCMWYFDFNTAHRAYAVSPSPYLPRDVWLLMLICWNAAAVSIP